MAATSCKKDSDCTSLNYWIEETKCIRYIYDFDAARTTPDKDFITLKIGVTSTPTPTPTRTPASSPTPTPTPETPWSKFIRNGINAGFDKTGKQYSWFQQTKYHVEYACQNNQCVMVPSTNIDGEKCNWGCDVPDGISNSNRCMCERLYEALSCLPDWREPNPTDPNVFERYQGVFSNEDGSCKKEYKRYFLCEGPTRCGEKDGKVKCLPPDDPVFKTTSSAAYTFPSTDIIVTGGEVSTAEFIEKYGYSPIGQSPFEEAFGDSATGTTAASRYGLDRVLLEWDSDKITETMCTPLLKENESGYFCDAAQLSIMAFKKFESLKEKAREAYAGLDEEAKKKLEEVTLLR
ncbi:MAG: hypothetical protein V1493_06720, partial [Candidatus Diapherotrites archaeon]